FLGGIVVAGVAFLLFRGEPAQPEPPVATVPFTVTEERSFPATDSNESETVATQEPPEAVTPRASSNPTPEPIPLLPIWLPRDFEWLSTTPSFLSFQRENLDSAWSGQTERQITEYFSDRPAITSK